MDKKHLKITWRGFVHQSVGSLRWMHRHFCSSAKLKEPVMVDQKFEDVVKSAQDAAVLVLVY